MKSFEYCVPTRVVFGTDSLDKLPAQLEKSKASRVLVVYGGQSAKKSGLLDKVLSILSGAGISHQELGGVQPNPHLGLAREGVKKAIAMDAQLILAIGGGSGESFLSKNKGKGLDAKLARATKWTGAAFLILTFVLNLL